MTIKRLGFDFSICTVKDFSTVKTDDNFCFFSKTDEEQSLVCITNNVPDNTIKRSDGWKAFRIQGVLDFSLIGILSRISALLADNSIGVFVVSTYNTDYILTNKKDYDKALEILSNNGYEVI